MKIKFVNGAERECAAPTEQKLFKSTEGKLTAVGWMLNLKLLGNIDSVGLDDLLSADNISSMEFLTDEGIPLFKLDGYDRITSTVIRHSEFADTACTDIQMSKGV